jgi:DNA (cytosine-5)-methyltransferase 1
MVRDGSALDALKIRVSGVRFPLWPFTLSLVFAAVTDCWPLASDDCSCVPYERRPDCHRNGGHTYKSVYGRLHWDRPAQTITTGFSSVGQGRFVHPRRPRTITPHEAARLQFIPDFFRFGSAARGELTTMIGNAVPPRATFAMVLALLR